MSAPTMSLRVHAAEASRAFEWAIEDADDVQLMDVVERAAWALLFAAEASRPKGSHLK